MKKTKITNMKKISKPYHIGDYWYVKLPDGTKVEFDNDTQAYEYYDEYCEAHKNEEI